MTLTPRTAAEWGATAPTWLGIGGLIACFIVWIITSRVAPEFVTAFGGLLAIGQGSQALASLREPPIPPVPPSNPPDQPPMDAGVPRDP